MSIACVPASRIQLFRIIVTPLAIHPADNWQELGQETALGRPDICRQALTA